METSPKFKATSSSPLTCSPEDSPVRTSAKPGNEPESKALAQAFGLNSPALLGSFDPGTCSLKTSQACLFGTDYQEYLETFPDSGMWESGEVYELQTSAPPIFESESLLWPTPVKDQMRCSTRVPGTGGKILSQEAIHWPTANAHDGTGKRGPGFNLTDHHYKPHDLCTMADQWPTPQHSDYTGANNSGSGSQSTKALATTSEHWQTPHGMSNRDFRGKVGGCGGGEFGKQANHWTPPLFPTPASRDYRTPNKQSYQERSGTKKGEQLQNFVEHSPLWTTPTADDGPRNRSFKYAQGGTPLSLQAQQIQNGPPSCEPGQTSRPPSSRRLNPRFVEWLMGFPIGWTAL
jgi:hypothetical protein